jgi:hypothetical protein
MEELLAVFISLFAKLHRNREINSCVYNCDGSFCQIILQQKKKLPKQKLTPLTQAIITYNSQFCYYLHEK